MFLKEAILENFMSYNYARIPFKPGINVICGPNGAGKSSILLAVSVALGQSYTERSKKLAELVRWGESRARVTLVLDNSPRDGRRPVSRMAQDEISLTRYIDRSGRYWFELNDRIARKKDVVKLLSKFGMDPENLLIIMHQDMIGEFLVLPAQEKLRMVESAVGFESYRKHLLAAQERLNKIVGKERALKKILSKAKETLDYWKREYERFKEKRRLMLKVKFLQRALAWERVDEQEKLLSDLEREIEGAERQISNLKDEIEQVNKRLEGIHQELPLLKSQRRGLLDGRIQAERQKATLETQISSVTETSEELLRYLRVLEGLTDLRDKDPIKHLALSLQSRIERHQEAVGGWKKKLAIAKNKTVSIGREQERLESRIDRLTDDVLEEKIKLAIRQYRVREITRRLQRVKSRYQSGMSKLKLLTAKAQPLGPRVLVGRDPDDIIDDINVTRGRLSSLGDVKKSAEKMYEVYRNKYNDIEGKIETISMNRESLLEEIETRKKAWRAVIRDVVERVEKRYQATLDQVGASGRIDLLNTEDIENVGLELMVGFRGSEIMPLTAYTQSGGEKSVATMVFFLSLQQYTRSPLRAVDEYDIHMDPTNREAIFRYTLEALKGQDAQYILITPRRIPLPGRDVHVLTVQATRGESRVQRVD
ncbi:MAG: AAA family ATPase [Candidatus Bathyarchaeia archaeon]